jgi:hypothetical protein
MKIISKIDAQRKLQGKRSTMQWCDSIVKPGDIQRFQSRNPDWDPLLSPAPKGQQNYVKTNFITNISAVATPSDID